MGKGGGREVSLSPEGKYHSIEEGKRFPFEAGHREKGKEKKARRTKNVAR